MMASGIPYLSDDGSLLTRDGVFIASQTVDDFERANINPYSGSVDVFDATTNRASEGSWSLRAIGGSGNKSILSMPGDGLPHYPSRGDTIKFDIQFDEGGHDYYFGFFHGSGALEEDSYELAFELPANDLVLYNDKGVKNRVELGRANVNYNLDSWCAVEIDTHSGGIDVSFRGTHEISVTDTSRDSGGILFFTSGGRAFWDNVRAV